MNMKRLLLPLLIVPLCVFADGGLPNQPYIYVEGKAHIEKKADIVTVRFEVVARDREQAKANQTVQATANKIFALLKDRKVADNDVIAEDVHSEPEFEEQASYPSRHGKLIGYKVTRPFEVKIRDIVAFPKLADELIGVSGVEVSATDWGLDKQTEAESEAFDKALANAREQAEKTVKLMNMKIDSVFVISPEPISEIISTMFPKDRGLPTERVVVTGSNIPTAEEAAPSRYQVAPVTVVQIVHVIYLISPAK